MHHQLTSGSQFLRLRMCRSLGVSSMGHCSTKHASQNLQHVPLCRMFSRLQSAKGICPELWSDKCIITESAANQPSRRSITCSAQCEKRTQIWCTAHGLELAMFLCVVAIKAPFKSRMVLEVIYFFALLILPCEVLLKVQACLVKPRVSSSLNTVVENLGSIHQFVLVFHDKPQSHTFVRTCGAPLFITNMLDSPQKEVWN